MLQTFVLVAPLALGKPYLLKKKISRVFKKNHPRKKMVAKSSNRILLSIKIVHASAQSKPYVDSKLSNDIPSLKGGFNTFYLLHHTKHSVKMNQELILRIAPRYRMKITPKTFKDEKIAFQVDFLRKKTKKKILEVYASTSLRLQNGGTLAFVGPKYKKKGKLLIVFNAKNQ